MSAARSGAARDTVARRAVLDGLLALLGAGLLAGLIASAERVITGLYPTLTWVKVGVLYLVSFLGASLRVLASFPGEDTTELTLRLPILVASILVGGLLWRAGARCERWSGVPIVTLVFAAPVVGAAAATELHLADRGLTIAPIRWQALAVPFAFALVWSTLGRVSRLRERILARGRWSGRVVAAAQGGWRMWNLGMALALVGVLVLAAVKSSTTTAYARALADAGTTGALVGGHHLLLLGNQSVFVLDVASGGEVRLRLGPDTAAALTLDEVRLDPSGPAALLGVEGSSVPLGGGFYAFFVVPAIATVLGGRSAGSGWRSAWERAGRGALAGLVYGTVFTGLAFFSTVVLPVPIAAVGGSLTLEPALVPTVIAAFAWGLAGGTLGGLTSPYVR